MKSAIKIYVGCNMGVVTPFFLFLFFLQSRHTEKNIISLHSLAHASWKAHAKNPSGKYKSTPLTKYFLPCHVLIGRMFNITLT